MHMDMNTYGCDYGKIPFTRHVSVLDETGLRPLENDVVLNWEALAAIVVNFRSTRRGNGNVEV